MPLRRYINALATVFATVVICSFALGVFMLVQRSWPIGVFWSRSAPLRPALETHVLLDRAVEHLKQGDTEQALMAYRQVLSADPRSIDAQIGLAYGELRAGREDIAQREFGRAIELAPDNVTAILEVARIQSHRQRSWPAAELSYRDYLKRKHDDADAWLGLARVLAWQKKSSEAADIFGRNDVATVMTAKDQRDYAFALVRSGRMALAETLLKKLIERQPDDFEVKLQLAGIYSSRQDWDSALPIYEVLLGERPDDLRLNLTYGLGLLSMKRYKQALLPLEKARNMAPSDGEAGLGFARALKGAGDLRRADREFERVLSYYSGNAALSCEYADLLLERRDYAKSERFYKEGYSLGLRDDRLLVGLAGALSGTRKYKEAVPYLEGAYQRKPTDRLAFELAKLYQKMGRNDRARELLSKLSK